MISAGDFRNGVTFDMDGNVYQIVEFQHVKPGKRRCFCAYQDPQCNQRRGSGAYF